MTSTIDASPKTDSGALTQAKDVALEKTEEVRAKVGTQVADRVREQADQRSTMLGEQVSSIASALKSTSSSLRADGSDAPAKAIDTVTQQVEKVGTYLTEANGDKILHDLEDAARKRPWAVAAGLAVVGFAASRVLGASSKQRYTTRQVGQGGYTSFPTGTGRTATVGLPPSQLETRTARDGGYGNGSY